VPTAHNYLRQLSLPLYGLAKAVNKHTVQCSQVLGRTHSLFLEHWSNLIAGVFRY